MIAEVTSLARPAILALTAYKSARSLATKGDVFLDANESPFAPEGELASHCRVNRYPEPQPEKLIAALSSLYGVPPGSILAGRGADDAIDTLVRTFCEAGKDGILVCPPTYGMYEVAANIQGAFVDKIIVQRENGFVVEPEKIFRAVRPGLKLVFLCSPNNPTGTVVPEATVTALCRALWGKAIVVLDEAYIEFSETPSLVGKLSELPNLVVLRTLSKAWAMAGARCGVALAHPEIVSLLQKVRAPYPISSPSSRLVLEALTEKGLAATSERVRRIRAERERLSAELSSLSGIVERVFPSEANFILVKAKDSRAFLGACRDRGIIVRDRGSEPGLEGCVRVSVGTEEENELLLKALRETPLGN